MISTEGKERKIDREREKARKMERERKRKEREGERDNIILFGAKI